MNTEELQVLKHRNQLLETLSILLDWITHCQYNNEFVKVNGDLSWGPKQLIKCAEDAEKVLHMNPIEFDLSDVPILDGESQTDLVCTNEWFVQKLVSVFKSHEIGEDLPPERAKYLNMILISLLVLACNSIGIYVGDKKKVVEEILSNDYDEICMKSLIKELIELMRDYEIGRGYTLTDTAVYTDVIDEMLRHALQFVGIDCDNKDAVYNFLIKKIDNGLTLRLG